MYGSFSLRRHDGGAIVADGLLEGHVDIDSAGIDLDFVRLKNDEYTQLGTGSGRFYGPAAEEVAGEFAVETGDSLVTKGVFAGQGETR